LVERDVTSPAGRHCDALGLYWCVKPDERLGIMIRLARDAAGTDLLPTMAEEKQRLAEEKQRLAEEKQRAEARVRELEAELKKRG
jgi:hypothetical protein